MNSWSQLHDYYVNENDNKAKEFVNNMHFMRGNESQYASLLKEVDKTIATMRESHYIKISNIRRNFQEILANETRKIIVEREFMTDEFQKEIFFLREEIARLNNNLPEGAPIVEHVDPPERDHRRNTCEEILDIVESVKETMTDQTYIIITKQLMEIYHR